MKHKLCFLIFLTTRQQKKFDISVPKHKLLIYFYTSSQKYYYWRLVVYLFLLKIRPNSSVQVSNTGDCLQAFQENITLKDPFASSSKT